jgi:lipopolysaccharide biosynthesis glycosyltransferase
MIKFCTILNDYQFNYFELMMKSYIATQTEQWPWLIYDCGLSEENKEKINSLYPDVEFKDINYNLYEGIQFYKSNREWNHSESRKGVYNAAYRFDIFLEQEPEWLFYIDSDILFLQDISTQFNVQNKQRRNIMDAYDVIGAPRRYETFHYFLEHGVFPTNKGRTQFINAGVLGLRKTVRTEMNHKELVEMCRSNHYEGNQQPINEVVLQKKFRMALLTPMHNLQTEMFYALEDDPSTRLKDVKIIHFTGVKNPEAFKSREAFYLSLGSHYEKSKKVCEKIYTKIEELLL